MATGEAIGQLGSSTMSAQKEFRPGWIWAIAIWYFGGAALLIVFAILMYGGVIHLSVAQQVRWNNALSHAGVPNSIVSLLLLTGTALLFRLRKLSFYVYCCALAGNVLIGVWILIVKGPAALPGTGIFLWTLGAPLLLCLYSGHLIRKKVLV
jgi:hypothetical protein